VVKRLALVFALLVASAAAADQTIWQGDLTAGRYKLVQVVADTTVPPIPPDPPVDPTECHEGYLNLDGWWAAWCGRSKTSFRSQGTEYGAMKSNTQAVTFLDEGNRYREGWIEIEVYFATDRVPQGTGGLHIMSATSAHKGLGSPQVGSGYAGWLRPDFETRPIPGDGVNAELKIGTYFADRNGAVTVKNWNTGIILWPKVWIPIRFGWHRNGTTFAMDVNGRPNTLTISPDCVDIFGMSVGNMDGLANYGGTPEVRFRKLRYGRLDQP
jgi:hypothetical protein